MIIWRNWRIYVNFFSFFSQNKYAYAIGTIVFLFGPTIVSFIVEAATRLLKLAGVTNYREERKVSK